MKNKIFASLLVLCIVLCFNTYVFAQNNSPAKTKYERIKDAQIPENELKEITTEELLERCLNYPFLVDITVSSNAVKRMKYMKEEFNGFIELFNNRSDAADIIFNKYLSMDPNDRNDNKGAIPPYSYKIFYLTFFLAQDEIMNAFKGKEKMILTELCLKSQKMNQFDQNYVEAAYGFLGENFVGYSLAKYLDQKNTPEFDSLKIKYNSVKEHQNSFYIGVFDRHVFRDLYNLAEKEKNQS